MKTNFNTENFEIIDSIKSFGNHWTKCGNRYYLSNEFKFNAIGLEIERYNTGNICYASIKGEQISNSEGRRILDRIAKCYVDLETGKIYGAGNFESEIANAINSLVNDICETLAF